MGFQCLPAIFLVILILFMPNSPRWLASKGRNEEAKVIIAKIRGETINDAGKLFLKGGTTLEYQHLVDTVVEEAKIGQGNWSDLLVRGLRNRLCIAVLLQFWQQLSGINVILYYQTALITGMGFSPELAQIPFTLANDFINFISTFPGMYLVDVVGRRKLLIMGGLGMGTAHFLVCLFVGLSRTPGMEIMSWGAIFSVYLFFFCFASTWGYNYQ
jgi:hypothetical protein